MHMMWANMDNASHACAAHNGHKDMWTGDISLGMFIFGDVYSCSTWIVHTYTRTLHTIDKHGFDMDSNLAKIVCCRLQCQLKLLEAQRGKL